MEANRGARAFRAVFHLPRTVRLRLAVLYGLVVLVAGGALLAITFAFGSFQSTKNLFGGGCALDPGRGASACIFRIVSAGAVHPLGQSGALTIIHGGAAQGSLNFAQAEQTSARIASSGTV